jgi:hypothetical protein
LSNIGEDADALDLRRHELLAEVGEAVRLALCHVHRAVFERLVAGALALLPLGSDDGDLIVDILQHFFQRLHGHHVVELHHQRVRQARHLFGIELGVVELLHEALEAADAVLDDELEGLRLGVVLLELDQLLVLVLQVRDAGDGVRRAQLAHRDLELRVLA